MSDQANSEATLTDQVRGVIENIRPLLQRDGGDIQLIDVDESTGVVSVTLQGACSGCPHAAITLKMGVEHALRQRVPEIREVVNVG